PLARNSRPKNDLNTPGRTKSTIPQRRAPKNTTRNIFDPSVPDNAGIVPKDEKFIIVERTKGIALTRIMYLKREPIEPVASNSEASSSTPRMTSMGGAAALLVSQLASSSIASAACRLVKIAINHRVMKMPATAAGNNTGNNHQPVRCVAVK